MPDNLTTPNGVPVRHGDHGLKTAHLALIDEVLASKEGFFVEEVSLPPECSDLTSALYGPKAGDRPVPETDVRYLRRGNRRGPSRLVYRPARPVRQMVIVGRGGDDPVIFTAYGSEYAAPREWWDDSMNPLEAIEAAAFWSTHALSVDVLATKPDVVAHIYFDYQAASLDDERGWTVVDAFEDAGFAARFLTQHQARKFARDRFYHVLELGD